MTPDQQQEIDAAIAGDQTVRAIDLYRAATGSELADAVEYLNARKAALPAPPADADGNRWTVAPARSPARTTARAARVEVFLLLVMAILAGVIVSVVAIVRPFGP
jgi:hypothetical protein